MRHVVTCRLVKLPAQQGGTTIRKRCGSCGYVNARAAMVCRQCHRRMVLPKRTPKLPRGSPERLQQELAHAAKMADAWAVKVKRAVTAMHEWNRRERHLAAKIAAGPQPPRPKPAPKPKRGIALKGEV